MTKEKVKSPLKKKKIMVVPNKKPSSFIRDVDHVASFLAPKAQIGFTTPVLENGKFVNVLTNDEKEFFENELRRSLSIYDREDNFWENLEIILDKNKKTFDMSDPMDYIKVKVLQHLKNEVAPSEKNKNDKATYKYYLVDLDEASDREAEEADFEEKVYDLFSELKKDRSKMIDFLEITGKKVNKEIVKDSFLISEIRKKYIKGSRENMQLFYDTLTSDDFEISVLINKGLKAGAIKKDKNSYYLAEGDKIAHSLNNLKAFLRNPKNQDTRFLIEERIQNSQ